MMLLVLKGIILDPVIKNYPDLTESHVCHSLLQCQIAANHKYPGLNYRIANLCNV